MAQKVLLVDDDQYIRELYEEVLKNAGFEVETAEDGKMGFEKMQQGGYDLVLLDIMMPYLDGIGILKKLGEEPPKMKNGPVVLLTNLAYDPVVKEAMENGVAACLNKADMNPDEFLNRLKEICKLPSAPNLADKSIDGADDSNHHAADSQTDNN